MDDGCYAMVRGSGIRLTDLDSTGAYNDADVHYATSKSVTRISINEVTESGGNELVRNAEEEPRLHFVTSDKTVRYDVDINFLRCDPSILNLMTGVPVVVNANGDVVGFDATTRLKAKSFGLEVWSKLSGVSCVAELDVAGFGEFNFGMDEFGGSNPFANEKPFGYTLFPFLKGGTVGGFSFANGLISFNVRGARTQRVPKWGIGPYDMEGPYMRLLNPVSRNTAWRTLVTTAPPPEQGNGVVQFADIIDGNIVVPADDILDGNTGPWIVSGNP